MRCRGEGGQGRGHCLSTTPEVVLLAPRAYPRVRCPPPTTAGSHRLQPAKPFSGLTVAPAIVIVFWTNHPPTLHCLSASADSIAIRRGEVSAFARAQDEGTNACGRHAATPFTVSEKRTALSSHLWAKPDHSLYSRFEIQIQGPNLRFGSEAYRPKSETMGGIGEKLGGVA